MTERKTFFPPLLITLIFGYFWGSRWWQNKQAKLNDFRFDKYKAENDANESPNETIDVTTTTTIAPNKDIVYNKKQKVGDLNSKIPSSINTGDNKFFTSDSEEKEVFPTSSLLN